MVGGHEGATDDVGVVADRIEYVELLADDRLATQEVVAAVDDSRSTVTRALRELREAGLVSKADGAYTATLSGTMAAAAYREYEATAAAIFSSRRLLSPLDGGADLPHDLLRGADVRLAGERGPFAALEAVTDGIARAERSVAYLPTLSNPHLLRVWHEQVVAGTAAVDLTVPPDVFDALQGRYPDLLGEMSTGDMTARTAPGPEYGLVLADRDADPALWVLVYAEHGTVHGVLRTDRDDAVAWGDRTLDAIRESATGVTDELAALAPRSDGGTGAAAPARGTTAHGVGDPPLPDRLGRQGFVQLSDDYFDERSAGAADTAWRTGLSLADVDAGRAVERVRDGVDGPRRLDRDLVSRLRAGDDCVLLGPPGSGKSTVCKQVACEWRDGGHGPVLYRERGDGQPFDSPSLLEAHLRRVEGHALVVVEDVVRTNAAGVFDAMDALRGRDDVSFLFDARRREWRDANDPGGALAPRSAPNSGVEVVTVPELDEADCQRFVDAFEDAVGVSVDRGGAELLAAVRDREGAPAAERPGEVLLLCHRLGALADPLAPDDPEPGTTLGDEARRACEELAAAESDGPLDAAVLTAVLNAAGLPVGRDLLHALVAVRPAREVAASLEALEGRMLFDASAAEYHTRHETWAETFLDQLAAVEGEAAARRRFERCVNALFALPDDPELRARIRTELDRPTPNLNQMKHHPGTWADEAVERVFGVGARNKHLKALFGRTGESGIELPDRSAPAVRARQAYWRGLMCANQGETDAAVAEFERLGATAASDDEIPRRASLRLEALARLERGEVSSLAGDRERARRHLERALDLAERADAGSVAIRALRHLGYAAGREGEARAAMERFEDALARARERGDERATVGALVDLGGVSMELGETERSERLLERAIETARRLGDRQSEAEAGIHLAALTNERGELERARERARRSRELLEELGNDRAKALAINLLGRVAYRRGDLERARACADRALEFVRRAGSPRREGIYLELRSLIERHAGDYDAAVEHGRRARAALDESGGDLAMAEASLAATALCRGDLDLASECIERGRSMLDGRTVPLSEARFELLAGRLAHERGDAETADERAKAALDAFRELGSSPREAECLRVRAAAAAERGRLEDAAAFAADALAAAEDSGVVRRVALVSETAAAVARRRDDPPAAREHLERAADAFAELGDAARRRRVAAKLADVCRATGDGDAAARWAAELPGGGDAPGDPDGA